MNINGHWYTETEAQAYIITLEHKNAALEDKHLSECRQIALYDDELQQAWRQGYIAGRACIDSRYEFIARHYGYETQREQLVEECSEAILAVQKLKRHGSKDNFEALEEEVADVLIMATQMRLLMSTSTIDRIVQQKLQRQIQRIKEDEV